MSVQFDRTQAESSTFKMVGGVLQADPDFRVETIKLIRPGTIIDRKYRIENLLGEGGMGAVYRAHHLALDTDVALKTFRSTAISANTWERFQLEARALAKLESQNIVRVFDFGCDQTNRPYYTMELLSGESLAERIKKRGPLPLVEALRIFKAVARGMVAAHSNGIVHRDLKPGNIFITFQGDQVASAKLVDFGIAKLVGSLDGDGQRLTAAGCIFGSPLYMSPEQSLGEEIDGRTDIYSFGCAFFEALSGKPPFMKDTAFATVMSHQTQPPPALSDVCPGREFPSWLQNLITRMLAKNRAKRVQSFQEILDVIAYYRRQERKAARPPGIGSQRRESAEDGDSASDFPIVPRPQLRKAGPSNLIKVVGGIVGCAIVAGGALSVIQFNGTDHAQAKPVVKAPPVKAKTSRFFKGVADTEHGPVKVFLFPNINMGHFYMPEGHGSWVKCQGEVHVPADSKFVYIPSFFLSGKPWCFAGFEADDLRAIVFEPKDLVNCSWDDSHIKYIAHLSNLEELTIRDTDVSGDSAAVIGNFKKLRHLDVSDTKLTGKDLAGLSNLYGLTDLLAAQVADMQYFLKHADASRLKLTALNIKRDGLADSEMSAVAKIQTLKSLDLQENLITTAGLKHLKILPQIERMQLYGTDIGPDAIDVLCQFKTLKAVELPPKLDSPESRQKLKAALPGVTILRWVSGNRL